jgi:hypothetical protein
MPAPSPTQQHLTPASVIIAAAILGFIALLATLAPTTTTNDLWSDQIVEATWIASSHSKISSLKKTPQPQPE